MVIHSTTHLRQINRVANARRAKDRKGDIPRFSTTQLMKPITDFKEEEDEN